MGVGDGEGVGEQRVVFGVGGGPRLLKAGRPPR